ncbi:MAG TPA: GlsB/YeaQ/YmgE family stress response membrane protein, partial [Pirellulales bacterium]|nr:GlsB/YeaQ/YmgE family stress response membrane protein [Pirellulales bacterium]
MAILYWAVFGLIAGAIAKLIMPGRGPGGIILTIILGIIGAVVGGFIGTRIGWGGVTEFNLNSMLLAVGGGVLVLFLYGLATKGRG